MNMRAVIEQLGYSPQEVTVYLAALELGGSTVTEIAAKAKLPRTTVNLVIHSLQKRGLMNAYLKRRRKILTAENPERLMTALKESEAALTVVLPEIQLLRHDTSAKSTVRTYNGAQEIKQIMNDILESKHHISAMLSWDDWVELLGKPYLEDFIETRYRHYLRIRLLAPENKKCDHAQDEGQPGAARHAIPSRARYYRERQLHLREQGCHHNAQQKERGNFDRR